MAISEELRRELDRRLRAQLDPETATMLMEVTVPANVDLATRGDVQELRAELLLRITGVESGLAELGVRIAELGVKLAALDAKVDVKLGALDVKLTRGLYRVILPTLISVQLLILGLMGWWTS